MRMSAYAASGFAIAVACTVASGHAGRTDANGGHNDRKNGGYHYHNGGGTSIPAYNTGRGSDTKREPRTAARITARAAETPGLLAEVPVPKTPPPERHLPQIEILEKVQTDDGLVVRVQLDDAPGVPRPTQPDVVEISKTLQLKEAVRIEFYWKRGRYKDVPWAEVKEARSESPVAMIKQDSLDFDVLSERVSAISKTYVDAVAHPYHYKFPNKNEVRELFDDLKIKGDCTVRFFWPGTIDLTNPCAQVLRDRRHIEPQIGLYPRSSAVHK